MPNKCSKRTPAERAGRLLFFTLIISAIYSLARIIAPQPFVSTGAAYAHVRSDYVLMFIQCLLGLVVLSFPSIVSRKLKFNIPNFIYIMYYIFLYCAIFLGEVLNFYYVIPHWDVILHFFSGAMLGALGFILVSQLNDSEMIRVSLSPFFVALFAFCFALRSFWNTKTARSKESTPMKAGNAIRVKFAAPIFIWVNTWITEWTWGIFPRWITMIRDGTTPTRIPSVSHAIFSWRK